jgi:hypothetical protein
VDHGSAPVKFHQQPLKIRIVRQQRSGLPGVAQRRRPVAGFAADRDQRAENVDVIRVAPVGAA